MMEERDGDDMLRMIAVGAMHGGFSYLRARISPARIAELVAKSPTLRRVLDLPLGPATEVLRPSSELEPPRLVSAPTNGSAIVSAPAIVPVEPSRFLDERQLCAELGISPVTATKWRRNAEGPPFIRVGRLIRYSREAFDAWLASRTVGLSRVTG